ncbi:6-phosphogluconolactonase [Acidiphilium sp.]|uniref:6-phosphogluconolactonase n=1 Tax=Acidiphilium sp. TaxID=527 RepID=UPI003D07108D
MGELMVVADAAALAEAGARLLLDVSEAAPQHCIVGLAGGSTPKPLYERLARPPYRQAIDWPSIDFVLGDERFVAPNDPASNAHMIRSCLFDHLDHDHAHLHAVPFEGLTIEQAAAAYEHTLKTLYRADTLDPARPLFDLCFLGMGDDGHTASLLPGQSGILEERSRWVVPVTEGRPEPRVTLTVPLLESARLLVFIVTGAGKRAMLDRILSGAETDVPAARLRPHGRLLWLVDAAAAGRWAPQDVSIA